MKLMLLSITTLRDSIDAIRLGLIDQAFARMGRKLPFGVAQEVEVTPYEEDPSIFKIDMKDIAGLLKRLGF